MRIYALKIFLLFTLLAGSILKIFPQTYNFENFSVEDGLAQNQVLSIFQDNHGYLWFGTNGGGISIYDGKVFKNISQTDGLAGNVVFFITQDKNGKMLFCTNVGLSIYNGFKFVNYTTDSGLVHPYVFCVHEDENSELLLGTGAGIAKLSERKIIPFSEDKDSLFKNTGVFTIYKDSKENLWFGTTKKGIIKFNSGENKFTHISTQNGLDFAFVRTILEDKKGGIWAGTIKGLNKLDKKNNVTQMRMKDNETTITITSSLLSKDGHLWFATLSGLDIYKENQKSRYTENNGLTTNALMAILEDREGNIWLGTDGKGIIKLRYRGGVFRNYSVKNNLPNDVVRSIYQDKKGSTWIGSSSGITQMKEDGTVETFTKMQNGIKLGIATNTFSVAEDNEGNLWFATRNLDEACYMYDGKTFKPFSKNDGFSDNAVNFAFKDKKGVLWFGTGSGVTLKDGKNISVLPGTESKKIWWILEDRNSHYWFGTENGAIKYDGSSMQFFTKKDGLVDGRVRTIVQDSHGTYWFATDEGLFSYDGKTFRQIDQTTGLNSNTVYFLLPDGKYSLWIGTNKGLNRLNIDRYHSNKEIALKYYGKEDGFIGVECNSNAAFKDTKEHLWFGTVKGATVFNPEMETINTNEPLTHITNLRLEFENFNWTKYSDSIDRYGLPINLVLPYNKNHITFDFVGLSLTIPQKVKYQYKLEPLEASFTPPTSQNEAVYPHLPPGKYTFILKAKNNDDYWNAKPVEYHFTILPPWYQTWWFYTLCAIALVSAVWSYIVWREKNLQKQKVILETQVRERTAELREEKEKVEQINLEVIEKNKIIELKNKDITDSITYAQGIQQAILPPDEIFQNHIPDSFILFRPRDIVSGDFYWAAVPQLPEGKNGLLFAVCDCTGHGVPGGFVSMVGSNSLSRIVNEEGIYDPAKILDRAAIMVEDTFSVGKRQDGMDVILCSTDFQSMQFAAANNPLYFIRKKENGKLFENEKELNVDVESDTHYLFQIKADKQPVGAYDYRKPFTNHSYKLLPGDTIYLASDGFRDQFGGPEEKKFMAKNFKEVLISIQNKSMKDQKDILNKTIEDWMGDIGQNDDICIIGVRV